MPTSSNSALDARFAAAARDEGLPSLILEVSRRLENADTRTRHILSDRLEPHSKRMFFGSAQGDGMDALGVRRHPVAENEYPYSIATKYGIDHQLIGLLNEDLDATKLQIGDRLKVLDLVGVDLEMEIRVSDRRLALWHRTVNDSSRRPNRVLMAYVPIDLQGSDVKLPKGESKVTRSIRDRSAAGGEGVLRIDIDAEPFDRRVLTIQPRGASEEDIIAMDSPTLDRLVSVVRKGTTVRVLP